MRISMLTIIIFISIFSLSISPPPPFDDHCLIGQPPLYNQSKKNVPSFDVDLDQPAFDRWKNISSFYRQEIIDIMQAVKSVIVPVFGQKFVKFIDWSLADLDDRFPAPYADELRGIANVTSVPLGEIVLYNIFYEVFTVCTSIVAQDSNGKLYHARNMDFGLLMGWNTTSHDWTIAEKLRKVIFNVNFVKNGKIVYKATSFAGYIGIYTAVKPNAFAVTINERFKLDGGYRGIYEWFLKRSKASWTSWMVRQVLETAENYSMAVSELSTLEVIAPVYIIVSGTKSGEGQIIVRSRNRTDGVVELAPKIPNKWYILQTNTDPWKRPLFFDDRRTPGRFCMEKMGQNNANLSNIFQVLSSPTTLNKLTVYTTLMDTNLGKLETFVQKCPDPCWPW